MSELSEAFIHERIDAANVALTRFMLIVSNALPYIETEVAQHLSEFKRVHDEISADYERQQGSEKQ